MRATLTVTVVLCLLALSSQADDKTSCADASRTQYALNACTGDAFKMVDAELNARYQQILREYADDPAFIGKLKASQRAWIKFRDAELAALFPHDDEPRTTAVCIRCVLASGRQYLQNNA